MKKGDKYSKLALRKGYRCRSALKLLEIQKKFKIINGGADVLDLGCAPGGCLQVIKELTKGKIVAVDIRKIKPVEGVDFFCKDFKDMIFKTKFDVIFSDVGPITPGINKVDYEKAFSLEKNVFLFIKKYLKQGGNFISKIFKDERINLEIKKLNFENKFLFKPESSRKGNKEIYLICKNFKKCAIR